MIIFLLIWISLIFQLSSHILIPPFLPAAYKGQYYEQKLRISQLESVQFKISGLPKDVFWTQNGTIFGKPSSSGQWKINITYDTFTETGNYETLLTIKDKTISESDKFQLSKPLSEPLQIVFPDSLVFKKGQQQQIEFKLKNGIDPIEWKFTTLPKGVSQQFHGKLSVNIESEGIFILRVEATDYFNQQIQACVTLNVQNSIQAFTQTYANSTIYQPSESVNKLMQITQKQTQVTKQMTEAIKILDQQNQTLNINKQLFRRITNNLIQLQNEAKQISQLIQVTLKEKKINQLNLAEAYRILRNAEDNLNLAMIQQLSNNNLLGESQTQKIAAQKIYDKAASDLASQLKVFNDTQNRLLTKQQQKVTFEQTLTQKKIKYNQLAQDILQDQKDLVGMNADVFNSDEIVKQSQLQVGKQQSVVNQQETTYSRILQKIDEADKKARIIAKDIDDLNRQKDDLNREISLIDNLLNGLRSNELFNLQNQITNNDQSIQSLAFTAIKDFSSINYESSVLNDYINGTRFLGCSNQKFPSVKGVFSIKYGSIDESYYKTENGFKVLFGSCTKMTKFKPGDQVTIDGYTARGAIHADTIINL